MCVCVCVCVDVKASFGDGSGLMQKKLITSEWIHRLAQDLVEKLVMSQTAAD